MNRNLKKDLLVFFAVFGILTLPFCFTDLDIILQESFYDSARGWFLQDNFPWDFLYRYGIFLGYFMVLTALVIISASYWKKSLIKWRRASFFMLFVMIMGPGVLVNATFKEHWGRPRPREIKQFAGTENYVKPWVKGNSNGKSFPCGHASMGFIISMPFLFLRKRYKKWAWIFLMFGTIYGLLIGYARMVAGGHYASDVLWSAGMVWFVGIIGYYLLKVYNNIDENSINLSKQKKDRKIAVILMGIVVPVLTIFLLLATPYISNKEFHKTSEELHYTGVESLSTNFTEGIVKVSFSKDFKIKYSVRAFGLPNSRIGIVWNEKRDAEFILNESGVFTEVRNNIDIEFPLKDFQKNSINLEEGKIFISIPKDTITKTLDISIKTGDIVVYLPSNIDINLITKNSIINKTANVINDNLSPFVLNIDLEEGSVNIENLSDAN